MVHVNEAEERARKDAEIANRKRKQEDAKLWEGECLGDVGRAVLTDHSMSPVIETHDADTHIPRTRTILLLSFLLTENREARVANYRDFLKKDKDKKTKKARKNMHVLG